MMEGGAGDKTLRISVAVLGAGWYGIAAAKTYLQFDPSVALAVIDADSSVGGVWSRSRVYPGLVADSPAGLFEYSDMKMSEELGIEEWADITGDTVQRYLERYAQKFGVLERCMFDRTVTRIERSGSAWTLHVTGGPEDRIICEKLIVGTGITSIPQRPSIDTSSFNGKVLHSKDLGRMHSYLTSSKVTDVVVVGGNKSAVETVTMCATKGKTVTWLIRKDGRGPGILFTPRRNGKHRAADGASRWSGVFRPGIYAARTWIHHFLYSDKYRLGTWLRGQFWKAITRMFMKAHQSTHPNRKLLNPETTDYFWPVSGVSFMHDAQEELMRLVEDGTSVRIFRESITGMKEDSISISDGQVIKADAVVFATGWQPSQDSLFDKSMSAEIGLPVALNKEDSTEATYWQRLRLTGDAKVFELYPVLSDPPHSLISRDLTPHRLFRTIAPPKLAARHDNSLAFVGLVSNNQVSSHAEISALWAVAYLTGKLYHTPVGDMLEDRSEMDVDVATMNSFMERRYLGRKEVPDAAMEIQDYTDLMMQDLGLRSDRKWMQAAPSWLGYKAFKAEYFSPYMPRDYMGVVAEFLSKYGE